MGALFGFSGPPEPALLEGLGASLAHRGRHPPRTAETPVASLGVRLADTPAAAAARGAGVIRAEGLCVALAGHLLGAGALCREAAALPPPPGLDPGAHPTLRALATLLHDRGAQALPVLRGAFVLAWRDGDGLHLTRDAMGERTLHHARHRGRLLFASEPKGLWMLPGFPRRIRPRALARYLSFSFLPGDETMLEDVHELPPGTLLTFGEDATRPRSLRWFEAEAPRRRDGEVADDATWVRRFRDLHAAAVAERLEIAGDPVATLSGGIDSSVVVAELARQAPGRVRTFALHFGEGLPNELPHARAVARHLGTEHHELLLRPRHFLSRLRRIVWHLDDPIGDPVTVPNFEVATRLARETRWLFNGEGGDPCFGGPKNLSLLLHHWYGGVEREPGWRERRYLASYRRAWSELSWLLTPEWRRTLDEARDLEAVLRPYLEATEPPALLDKLMLANQRLKGAHLILPKVERMQGAAGIAALAPLFDERIARLSFRLPPRLKVSRGTEKVVLKRAYGADLPPEIIARAKSGMRVPVHHWFQGELRRYARKVLGPRELRRAGIFEPERVQDLLRFRGERGRSRFGIRLWMLLTFEIWRRIVIEREPV